SRADVAVAVEGTAPAGAVEARLHRVDLHLEVEQHLVAAADVVGRIEIDVRVTRTDRLGGIAADVRSTGGLSGTNVDVLDTHRNRAAQSDFGVCDWGRKCASDRQRDQALFHAISFVSYNFYLVRTVR